MSFSNGAARKSSMPVRVMVTLVVLLLALPVSPAQAEKIGELARQGFDSGVEILHRATESSPRRRPATQSELIESSAERETRVQHLRLCPRRLLLYVEETFTLIPLALDQNREAVHGVAMIWESKNPDVAIVSSIGEVTALNPGRALVTVHAGNKRANVMVEVGAGARLPLSDQQWDAEHGGDCENPEQEEVNAPPVAVVNSYDKETLRQGARTYDGKRSIATEASRLYNGYSTTPAGTLKESIRPAVMRGRPSQVPSAVLMSAAGTVTGEPANIARPALATISPMQDGWIYGSLDGASPDTFSAGVIEPFNSIGNPRHAGQEGSGGKTKSLLYSQNYLFSAPILSLGGRGSSVGLALNYNSRLWTKDFEKMSFNYNKGWPGAGWSLGYGRIVENYDGTATGDGTGTGGTNAPGNYLLILGDGTRIHLRQAYDSSENKWKHDSVDGTHIHFNMHSRKMKYSDGTVVQYNKRNGRLLPANFKNSNGDAITVEYRDYCNGGNCSPTFKFRWAIDYIYDTLGRYVRFYYYGDAGYPADPTNGKPQGALAAITAPSLAGGTRTLVELRYDTIQLSYSFSLPVNQNENPASGSSLTVLRRIYYPQSGSGYLLLDYSSYGMARHISTRIGMTDTGDGSEIGYTKYNYVDINNQGGALNDAPTFTRREEWWQGKTDDLGNPTSLPTVFEYSHVTSSATQVSTVTYQNRFQTVTTIGTNKNSALYDYGRVISVEQKDGGALLGKAVYTYAPEDSNPFGSNIDIQINTVEQTDEAGNSTSSAFTYGSYGRVMSIYEHGYKEGGIHLPRRRTTFSYSDNPDHLSNNLYRLVTQVRVYDATLDFNDSNDVLLSRVVYLYDNYSVRGGMEYYGLTSGNYPPNHDGGFDQNKTARGNATGVTIYSKFGPDVSTTRYAKYDIFGNMVEVDINNAAQASTMSFSSLTHYSQPDSATIGKSTQPPFLRWDYQYDFNTGFVLRDTDPDGKSTNYSYDASWNLSTVTTPGQAVASMGFDKDANQKDLLSYTARVDYTDGVGKAITAKYWFDGAGRVTKAGISEGSQPSTFDAVSTAYDSLGRTLRQSNPHASTGSPSYWTTYKYDGLSRLTEVALPDDRPEQRSRVQITYAGPLTTTTDQVGRSSRSQIDGLGRVVRVYEQDPLTGSLSVSTDYTYDLLDNLTRINQGGQVRSYEYDRLSRVTMGQTPEGGTTRFTYTDFGAIQKATDARNVETHFAYDALNRPRLVWHTGQGGDDSGSFRPALPAGVAQVADTSFNYRSFAPGNGQIDSTTDAAGTESYTYDNLGRPQAKTRRMDSGIAYTTRYEYNNANQLKVIEYPSGKRVAVRHDARGRISGLDKVDGANNLLSRYVTSVGYDVTGFVRSVGLNNGVSETYSFSADRLQLTGQTASTGAATLMNLSYSYSAAAGASGAVTSAGNTGQLMGISVGSKVNGLNRNQSFSYDNLGRLKTATGWGSWQRRYDYDRWGNRTNVWNAASGGSQLQSVGLQQSGGAPTNRATSITRDGQTFSQSYDAAGNLIGDGVHSYQYDAAGRLAKVDAGSANEASYIYDAANRRVKRVAGGQTTYYIWEGGRVIAEYSTGPQQGAGGTKYYHGDRLSTRLITDSGGAVKGTQDHLPYGEEGGVSGESEKHRFTNYERDAESGTDYALNRQYAMDAGRFMQPDVVGGSIIAPQTLNRYSYGYNDPVNMVDPDGQIAFAIAAVIVIGAGVVGGVVGAISPPEGHGRLAGFGIGFVSGLVGGGAAVLGAATGTLPGVIAGGAFGGFSSSITTSFLSTGTVTGDDLEIAGGNAVIGGVLSGGTGYLANQLVPNVGRPIVSNIARSSNPVSKYGQNLRALTRVRVLGRDQAGADNPYRGLSSMFQKPSAPPGGAAAGPNTLRTIANQVGGNTTAALLQPITSQLVDDAPGASDSSIASTLSAPDSAPPYHLEGGGWLQQFQQTLNTYGPTAALGFMSAPHNVGSLGVVQVRWNGSGYIMGGFSSAPGAPIRPIYIPRFFIPW